MVTIRGAQGQDWAQKRVAISRAARALAEEFDAIARACRSLGADAERIGEPVCPDCGEPPPAIPGDPDARLITRFMRHECKGTRQ
jgi:hypothetical protein